MAIKLHELVARFKGQQMTVTHLVSKLDKILPEAWLEYNGTVFKWENYFFKICYMDALNQDKDFDDFTIKILDVFEV